MKQNTWSRDPTASAPLSNSNLIKKISDLLRTCLNLRLGGPTAPHPSKAADVGADLQQLDKLRLTEKPPLSPLRGVHSSVASWRCGDVRAVELLTGASAQPELQQTWGVGGDPLMSCLFSSLVDSTGKF